MQVWCNGTQNNANAGSDAQEEKPRLRNMGNSHSDRATLWNSQFHKSGQRQCQACAGCLELFDSPNRGNAVLCSNVEPQPALERNSLVVHTSELLSFTVICVGALVPH